MFVSLPKILQRWIGVYSIREKLGDEVTSPHNKNFIVSRRGQIVVFFNVCSKSTQDRLLASNFMVEVECRCYMHLHYAD